MLETLHDHTTITVLVGLGFVVGLAFSWVWFAMKPLRKLHPMEKTLDQCMTGYSIALVYEVLKAYDKAGKRPDYVAALSGPDRVFCIVYGCSWALLLNRLAYGHPGLGLLWPLPLAAATLDFCENWMLANLTQSYPTRLASTAARANRCTQLKWLLIVVGALITVCLWLGWL